MIALACAPILLSLLLAGTGRRLAATLSGRAGAVLLTGAALTCSLATGFVLCALAVLAVAEVGFVARAGHWSSSVVADHNPVPVTLSVACGVTATWLVVASVLRAVRCAGDLRTSMQVCRRLGPGVDHLIVVDDPAPQAYALAGLPGRAVVSRAMLRELDAGERRALLAHEAAHVDHCHFVYVQLVGIAAAANPVLRPLVSPVRIAVERWADEVAAARVEDRGLVAVALARAGLCRAQTHDRLPAAALGAAASSTSQRVHALLTDRSVARSRMSSICIAAMLALAAGASLLVALRAHDVVELAEWFRNTHAGH